MSEEIFDVVDARDRVVGTAPRSVVHREGMRHRAVHVFLFNRAGQLFLQKRSMQKDSHPGHWDSSASGHVDTGEHYDTAVRRELREELGVAEVPPLEPMFYVQAQAVTGQEFCWLYRAMGEGPFALNGDEIDEGRWVDPHAIALNGGPVRPLSPCFYYLWCLYRQGRY